MSTKHCITLHKQPWSCGSKQWQPKLKDQFWSCVTNGKEEATASEFRIKFQIFIPVNYLHSVRPWYRGSKSGFRVRKIVWAPKVCMSFVFLIIEQNKSVWPFSLTSLHWLPRMWLTGLHLLMALLYYATFDCTRQRLEVSNLSLTFVCDTGSKLVTTTRTLSCTCQMTLVFAHIYICIYIYRNTSLIRLYLLLK